MKKILFAFFLFGLAASMPVEAEAKGDRPNLLLVTVDTLRADRLGCYGRGSAETPVMDGLARGGALFEKAFAHTPTTLPSHTNILLGLTPPAHGVHDNSGFIVRPEFLTLAELLKAGGYETGAFIGAFPLNSRFGLAQGFDVYDDACGSQAPGMLEFVERKAGAVIEKALGWLRDPKRAEPWFLWIHLFDPHQPWLPPEPYKTRYASAPYDGEVAYTDRALGTLLDYLRNLSLEGRTFIVLTGDHGESLGDHGELTHGYFAYNATLRVPLILCGPGIKPARIPANVGHVDVLPTVCDLLKLELPPGIQGTSLRPLLENKKAPSRPIYFESLNAYTSRGWAPLRGFIDGNEKFIDLPIPELYDLDKDFDEIRNLAGGRDLGSFRERFGRLLTSLSAPGEGRAATAMDGKTLAKLRSLGYVASSRSAARKTFTAADDLKTLLPFNQKWMEAMLLRDQGRTEEGIRLLEEIVAARKDFDLAYTYLAHFLKERGRFEEAVEVLRRSVADNPESFTILTAYGIILVEAGRFDEAVELLTKALDIIDYDPEAWNYLGVAFWNKGDFPEARKAYERALALDADDAIVIANVGSLDLSTYLRTRSRETLAAAVESYRKAVAADPAYPAAYNGIGAALKMAGDADGAIAAWTKAVELKPNFVFPLYNLGLTLLEQGEKAKALGFLSRYRDLVYETLSAQEKRALDDAIARCGVDR